MSKNHKLSIIAIAVLFISCVALYAAEPLNFYGIIFGSTTEETKKIMESKGWTVETDEVNKTGRGQHLVFIKENAEFAGRTVKFMEFAFGDNALFEATASFGSSATGTPVSQIAKSYSEKYGFKKEPGDGSFVDKYVDSKGNNFLICDFFIRVYSAEVYNKISGRDKKIEGDI